MMNGTLNPMIIDGDMAQPAEYPWVIKEKGI
jgi:hypothetical protein